MSQGPRRLLDDPDFHWETGCDLRAERAAVGSYDLAGLKERVMARVGEAAASTGAADPASPPAAASAPGGWPPAAKLAGAALVGVAAVGTAFWLGVQSGRQATGEAAPAARRTAPEVQAVEAPPEAAVVAPSGGPGPGSADLAAPSQSGPVEQEAAVDAAGEGPHTPPKPLAGPPAAVAPAKPVPAPAPAKGGPAPSAAAGAEGADVPGTAEESSARKATPAGAPGPRAEPAASGLQREVEHYDRCLDALDSRRHAASVRCFRDFLLAFPQGKMHASAELGLLRALWGAGDAEGTAALAAQLQRREEHASWYGEFRRLEAESLAKLGRCEHALSLARDLSGPRAPEIRRQVRKTCRVSEEDGDVE